MALYWQVTSEVDQSDRAAIANNTQRRSEA